MRPVQCDRLNATGTMRPARCSRHKIPGLLFLVPSLGQAQNVLISSLAARSLAHLVPREIFTATKFSLTLRSRPGMFSPDPLRCLRSASGGGGVMPCRTTAMRVRGVRRAVAVRGRGGERDKEVGEAGCCEGGGGKCFKNDVSGVNSGVVVHRGSVFEGRQQDGQTVEV